MDRIKLAKDAAQQLARSVNSLTKALEDHNRSQALVAAGKVFELSNFYASARSSYVEANGLDGDNHEARARLAIVELKLGLISDALKTVGALIEKAPEYRFLTLDEKPTSALTVLGDSLRASGNIPAAAKAYKRAIELVGDDGYAVGRAAELLVQSGDLKAAYFLVDRIPDHDLFSAVKSTLRLTRNDPDILPAILGFREGVQMMSHV